jgi:hypothetical protein
MRARHAVPTKRHGTAISDLDNASVTEHQIYGLLIQSAAAQTVDGVPTNYVQPDTNRLRLAVEVTTMTVGGTIRITGTSYDPDTGTETGSDTEDLVVTATGWLVSSKFWTGSVTWSSVGGVADIVGDFYVWDDYPTSRGRILSEVHVNWEVSGATNSMRALVRSFNGSADPVTIWDDTIANLTSGTRGHNVRRQLSALIPSDGTVLLSLFTQRVVSCTIEFVYT